MGGEVGVVVGSGEGTDVGTSVMNSRSGEENPFFVFHFGCQRQKHTETRQSHKSMTLEIIMGVHPGMLTSWRVMGVRRFHLEGQRVARPGIFCQKIKMQPKRYIYSY